jgi:hypothetical protein
MSCAEWTPDHVEQMVVITILAVALVVWLLRD